MLTDWPLLALFWSAFLSATLLPGNSEIALLALLHWRPDWFWLSIAVASLGNTLGSYSSYGLARLLKKPAEQKFITKLKHYGPFMLLLAWLPIVGDGLCLAAGYLRWPVLPCLLLIAMGKIGRYLLLAWLARQGFAW